MGTNEATKLKKTDILKLLMLVRVNFENSYNFKTEEEGAVFVTYWFNCLKDYPRDVVYQAFDNAIKNSEFAPKIKNILDEVDKLVNAGRKTNEELWAELSGVLYRVYDAGCDLKYGNEGYKRGNATLNKIWADLSEEIKAYCVNISALLEIAEMDSESKQYEKTRFIKAMPHIRETLKNRRESKQFMELLGASGLNLLGTKKDEN